MTSKWDDVHHFYLKYKSHSEELWTPKFGRVGDLMETSDGRVWSRWLDRWEICKDNRDNPSCIVTSRHPSFPTQVGFSYSAGKWVALNSLRSAYETAKTSAGKKKKRRMSTNVVHSDCDDIQEIANPDELVKRCDKGKCEWTSCRI